MLDGTEEHPGKLDVGRSYFVEELATINDREGRRPDVVTVTSVVLGLSSAVAENDIEFLEGGEVERGGRVEIGKEMGSAQVEVRPKSESSETRQAGKGFEPIGGENIALEGELLEMDELAEDRSESLADWYCARWGPLSVAVGPLFDGEGDECGRKTIELPYARRQNDVHRQAELSASSSESMKDHPELLTGERPSKRHLGRMDRSRGEVGRGEEVESRGEGEMK
jgi:hypothetical protein